MSRAPGRAAGRTISCVVALLVGLLPVFGATAGRAIAAGDHHAVVVVDTGSGDPHVVPISFSDDSISGLEALKLAGADPAVFGFSGLGGAVCALFGVGHPATNATCLGEPSDARFWAYWHVPAGQSGFNQSTYSRAGAGSVRVHDGDLEGWRYGTGEPPRSVSIPLPEPDAPPATAPRDTDLPPPAPVGGVGTTTATTAPGAPVVATSGIATAAGGSTTTSTTRAGHTTEVAGKRASAIREAGGGGSSMLSIAGFLAVLMVLGAGIFFARRARIGRSAGGS